MNNAFHVPKRNGQLGKWVDHQRTLYKKGQLGDERTRRLDDIGFQWTPKQDSANEIWETRFNELQKYREVHGDCKVPAKNGQLGNWVAHQRTLYRRGKLDDERTRRLDGIHFQCLLDSALRPSPAFCGPDNLAVTPSSFYLEIKNDVVTDILPLWKTDQ